MNRSLPRILLIGAGRFGMEHLAEWRRLAAAGEVLLSGVVVRHAESARRLRAVFPGPVHTGFDPALLAGIDGVDIVTPAATHPALVRACLPHAHVLVEKPLALDADEAAALADEAAAGPHRLMVGHVFRFHPLVEALAELLAGVGARPRFISGCFTNPDDGSGEGRSPRLEFLHVFDIVDLLYGVSPEFSTVVRDGSVERVSCRYPGPMNAEFELGWHGEGRRRTLGFLFDDRGIECDFLDNVIVVRRRDELRRLCFEGGHVALRAELQAFLGAMRGQGSRRLADAATGARVVGAAARSVAPARPGRARVAVVGGGIFGATCAIELGRFCDVTLFERHGELMTEASYLNQWRHHSGFHYPRSPLTVQEVKEARDEFLERYAQAVIRDFPSYYCTSAFGREITAERYLAICTANGLNFEPCAPPAEVVDPESVSLCLRTDEGVLDYPLLRRVVEAELEASPRVRVRRRTEVVEGGFGAGGEKRLVYRGPDGEGEEAFDFLVNATYANRNLVSRWFQFPVRPLRFDLLEMPVLELDAPRVSVTVLDGPFTSLLSLGRDNLFMLSHIHQSVLRSVITADGAPPQWGEFRSNSVNLLAHARRYLPVLERARLVESRYGLRTVYAHSEDFDGRPTVVTSHGFGCWSVLGGKIITCVHNAREIGAAIRRALEGVDAPEPVRAPPVTEPAHGGERHAAPRL